MLGALDEQLRITQGLIAEKRTYLDILGAQPRQQAELAIRMSW